MGRLLLLAVLLSAIAAGVTVAAGGVVLKGEEGESTSVRADAPEPRREATPDDDPLPAEPETRPVVAAAAGPVGATIRMDELAYSDARVEIEVGESVRWVNDDVVPHILLADDAGGAGSAASFFSPSIPRGGEFRTTFRNAGLTRYVCTLHPVPMTGVVVVK